MINLMRAGLVAIYGLLTLYGAGAQSPPGDRYPDWKGQWIRAGNGQGATWDPNTPRGQVQKPPLTPAYQAKYDENLREQANGQQGDDPSYKCIPAAMPRIMIAVQPMEIVITPDTTYVMLELFNTLRRIYTDGREWPKESSRPTPAIRSGTGRIPTATADTTRWSPRRAGSRARTPMTAPASRFTRMARRSSGSASASTRPIPNLLLNEITTIDTRLTRPWTVQRSYRRGGRQPVWTEYYCQEDNHHDSDRRPELHHQR